MERREVVVVGAGPAGSATAIFLRQRGHDVLLLDEARFPRDKVCGESVSPEGWRLLRALGAADRVKALGPRRLVGMRLVSPAGVSFRGTYRGSPDPGFALRRLRLDAALLGAARDAGVEAREGSRVTGLRLEAGHVAGVTLGEDGAGVEARLVVAADGRRSVVARGLGLLAEHPRLRKFAVRGHWEGMQGLEDRGEMHVGGGGYCGIAPLTETLANVAFVLDQREMATAGGDLEGFYRHALRRWPEIAERLEAARLIEPPKAVGPLALVARSVSAPGALLVGDAAGFYDPFTGEGVTLALRGAEIAARVASAALVSGCSERLLAYDAARNAATREKFRFNRLVQRIVAWPELGDAMARRLARRPELADRLVSIAGDFVPARAALDLGFVWDLLRS